MNDGNNLWCALDLVNRAGREVVAMQPELTKQLSNMLDKMARELGFRFEQGKDEGIHEDSLGTCTAWLAQWGIRPARNRKNWQGNLSVQIVLWTSEGTADPCGMRPRVEVGYYQHDDDQHDVEISPNYCCASTWFVSDEAMEGHELANNGTCIVRKNNQGTYHGARWDEPVSWIFAVPLFSINDNDAISKYIVTPTMSMLAGNPPEDALSGVPTIKFSLNSDGCLSPSMP